jgi:cytoskeletal protein CcmA (bactofilin family)
MRFKKKTQDEILSILGEGVELSGDISFTHGLRVEGLVKGKVRSEAFLTIGPTGRVQAEVFIRRISISGELRGVIHASERVEINKEGKVFGDLFTPCLIIEAGAHFDGKCNMSEKAAAKQEDGTPLKAVDAPLDAVKTPQQTELRKHG